MKHGKKKVRRSRRRRRGWQRTRSVRAYAAELIERWARATGRDPGGAEARRLERLTRHSGKHGLFSSNWMFAALGELPEIARLDAIDALEGFLRWAHAEGEASVLDVSCQLLNLELNRRKAGRESATIELPIPRPDEDLTQDELVAASAQWEAFSFGGMCAAHVRDEKTTMALASAALMVTTHLAEADGLPCRFDRLDPVAYTAYVVECERDPARGPAPDRFVPFVLGLTADFYSVLRERGLIAPEAAQRVEDDLTVLSMSYGASAA